MVRNSIHELDQGCLGSESNVTQKQFMALCIHYPDLEGDSGLIEPNRWISTAWKHLT